jgi:hypothetical protein
LCTNVALAVAWGAAPVAHGEPGRTGRTSALSWVRLAGAEGCIGAPALAEAVEKRLHRRVFVPPSDAEVSVEGTVGPGGPGRFRATFRVADRDGKVLGARTIEEPAKSCGDLDDRIAFVLSLLIDPEAALATPESAPPPVATVGQPPLEAAPAQVPAPSPPPRVEAPPPPPPERRAPWRWLVGVDFGGSVGLVPDVGWVVSGRALVAPPRWPSLLLEGSSYLPESRRIEGVALVDIGLVTGALGVCPLELRHPPFGFGVCVAGMLGDLSARGQGFPDSRGYSTLLGAAEIELLGELAFTSWLTMTLAGALVVPLSRATLAYDDAAGTRHTIFEIAPVGASLSVGLAVGSR